MKRVGGAVSKGRKRKLAAEPQEGTNKKAKKERFDLFNALSEIKAGGIRPDQFDVGLVRDDTAKKAAENIKDLLKARRNARLAALAQTGVTFYQTQEHMEFTCPKEPTQENPSRGIPEDDSTVASSQDKNYFIGPDILNTPWGQFLCMECGEERAGHSSATPKRWPASRPPRSLWKVIQSLSTLSLTQRLHAEIAAFATWCEPTVSELRSRREVLARVYHISKALWPKSVLVPFGSAATGLCLPRADVDICIMNVTGLIPKEAVQELVRALRTAGFARQLVGITKARIPIAKYIDDYTGLHVDISINQDSALETTQFIRKTLKDWQVMRPLILVLKMMLRQLDLGETYKGGIGSYMLFTMVLSYLQSICWDHPEERLDGLNLGTLLVGFFERYISWNYEYDAIDVREKGSIFPKVGLSEKEDLERLSYQISYNENSFLMSISSPLEPSNDIGKNSYRIEDCVDRFHQRLMRLKSIRDAERRMQNGNPLRKLKEASLLSAVINPSDQSFRKRDINAAQFAKSPFSIFDLRPELEIPEDVYLCTYRQVQRTLGRIHQVRGRAMVPASHASSRYFSAQAPYRRRASSDEDTPYADPTKRRRVKERRSEPREKEPGNLPTRVVQIISDGEIDDEEPELVEVPKSDDGFVTRLTGRAMTNIPVLPWN